MSARQDNSILTVSIVPHAGEDRMRLTEQISQIVAENSFMSVRLESHEDQLLLGGDDELRLEAISERIRESFAADIGEVQIAFRETIRKAAEAEGKYIRQTGGSGNHGHCWLRIEPNEPGKGYEFINEIKGGVVPKEYIKPIDQGVRGALELGILAGFPIVDVKVALFDGSYHEVDSNEMAFKFAGSIAFKEAARKASPVLLEPVMAAEVTVPEEFMGVIIGDINSRRGRIEGMEHAAGSQVIKAMVPLKEMLRSSRHGRPDYIMRFARFEPVSSAEGFGDSGAPVFAVKPRGPRPKGNAASAQPENHPIEPNN
jgi:elongation factor G